MEEHAARLRIAREAQEVGEAPEHVRRDRLPRLDFNRKEVVSALNDEVYLVSGAVTPEEERDISPRMHVVLPEFRHKERLDDRSAHRVLRQVFRPPDAQQVAEKPCVEEVELRGLDEALGKIAMVGLEEHDDKARL